jgi:hypothetical protein
MTLAISMLNVIFFCLHTKIENYHLKYPNMLYYMLKYNKNHFKKLLMLTFSKRDTFEHLGI